MQHQKDLVIVLRKIRFQDRHQIIHGLAQKKGRIEAIAYNSIASRRFGGGLEVFNASEWVYQEKQGVDLVVLNNLTLKKSLDGLARSLEGFTLASALNELALAVTIPEDCSEDFFKLHFNALEGVQRLFQDHEKISLCELTKHQLTVMTLEILNTYIAKLLQWSGSMPQFEQCLVCHKIADDIVSDWRREKGFGQQGLEQQGLEYEDCSFLGVIASAGWVCDKCQRQHGVYSTKVIDQGKESALDHRLLKVSSKALIRYFDSIQLPMRIIVDQVRDSLPASLAMKVKDLQEMYLLLEGILLYHIPGLDKKSFSSFRQLNIAHSVFSRSPF